MLEPFHFKETYLSLGLIAAIIVFMLWLLGII
jgi:hypothetical protein